MPSSETKNTNMPPSSVSATVVTNSSPVVTSTIVDGAKSIKTSHTPLYGNNVHISDHPILQHQLSVLRSSATSQDIFRSTLRAVTYHLGYEATSKLKTKQVPISICTGKQVEIQTDCVGSKLDDKVALIPILRSGLGMADGMMELLPKAAVHHIGMYHLHGSIAPVQYFNRLPKQCDSDIAYVVDPVIASSATMMAVIAILKKVRAPKVTKRSHHASLQFGMLTITCLLSVFLATVGCPKDSRRVGHFEQPWTPNVERNPPRCLLYRCPRRSNLD